MKVGVYNMDACSLSELVNLGKLKVIKKEDRCRYHTIGQIYSTKDISPRGLCQSAYHRLYPLCLARLYREGCDTNGQLIKADCLGSKARVCFAIEKRKFNNPVKKIEVSLRKTGRYFFPLECIDGNIFIRVIGIEGECPQGYEVGNVFKFNISQKKELCPAAFYNIFPLYAGNCSSFFSCPDHKTNITFEISPFSIDIKSISPALICSFLDDISISIELHKRQNNNLSVIDLIRNDICPLMAHTIYPYYLTLKNGGDFGWMKETRTVIAQCPNPENRVAVKLRAENECRISCEVIAAENCSIMKKGQTFFFHEIISDIIPPDPFFASFPFIYALHFLSLKNESIHLNYKENGDLIHFEINKRKTS